MQKRKLVIINQAANYLTVGFANAFNKRFDSVSLIAGSVHCQGEMLESTIKVDKINHWKERPAWKKASSYLLAMTRMWWLLMTRYRQYEVLFVSVPPMAYLLNLVVPHRFSMMIWDVYPDALKLGEVTEKHLVYRIWSWLNRRSFKKAYKIFTISEPMADVLGTYIDRNKVIVQPIWAIGESFDRIEKSANSFIHAHGLENKFIVQYSGNIGLSHNVEVILEIAKKFKANSNIIFQVIGRGLRKPYIERLVREHNLSNVQVLPFQSDEMFPHSLSAANLGVVTLHASVSRGSVPSKAYNLMKFGVPALYVASEDSELARYAREFNNAACYPVTAIDEMATFIRTMVTDIEYQQRMSANALSAAKRFTRSNADCFVKTYLFELGR